MSETPSEPTDTQRDTKAQVADDAEADNVSDPAHADEEGQDWSAEGGATAEGPATATEDD